MQKRILSLVLCLCMVLSLLSYPSLATESPPFTDVATKDDPTATEVTNAVEAAPTNANAPNDDEPFMNSEYSTEMGEMKGQPKTPVEIPLDTSILASDEIIPVDGEDDGGKPTPNVKDSKKDTFSETAILQAADVISYEQFKADHYIDYSSYSYYMYGDFTLPYRTVTEKKRADPAYQVLLNSWQVATFNLSNVVDYSTKRIELYEFFLYDILYNGVETTNLSGMMEKSVKATQASMLKQMNKMLDEELLKLDMVKMSPEQTEKVIDALAATHELSEVLGAISKTALWLGYVKDVEDAVYKFAKLSVISQQSKKYADVLYQIANNTGDDALSRACKEFADICAEKLSDAEIAEILLIDVGQKDLRKYMLTKTWRELLDLTGYGTAITVGQTVGKWLSGVYFSTDKEIETFYEMCALYDFENQVKRVVSSYQSQYSRSKTDTNARLFNTAWELMMKTMTLGCDISITYEELVHEKGLINSVWNLLFGTSKEYTQYKDSMKSIKRSIEFSYEYANGDLYNAYLMYCDDVAQKIGMTAHTTLTDGGSTATDADFENVIDNLKAAVIKWTDTIIRQDLTLTEDTIYYGNVSILSGNIDLNGHAMSVLGNLQHSGSVLTINGGKLNVGGNYSISGTGRLVMTNAEDQVIVVGVK